MEGKTAPYIAKPILVQPASNSGSIWRTLISLLFYILVYFALFRDLKSVLLLVIVIILHEFGHFAAMKWFGYRDVKIFFVPLLGAFVSGKHQQISAEKKALMILAGPVPGVVLGLICLWMYSLTQASLFFQFAFLFLFLNVFNLLPVSPMDGGQLLEVLFFRTNRALQTVFILLSCLALVLLAIRTGNYVVLIIVLLLAARLAGIYQQYKIDRIFRDSGIDRKKSYEELTDQEYHEIRQVLVNHYPSLKSFGQTEQPANEETMATYVRNVLQPSAKYEISTVYKSIFLLVWFCALIIPMLIYLYFSMSRYLVE